MTRTICIYHANCTDGFTAAWAVRQVLGDAVEFIPASYGEEPPIVDGADVILADFSYKRPMLDRMAKVARSILVLDHHKTAAEDLEELPWIEPGDYIDWLDGSLDLPRSIGRVWAEFDMDRSGAQIAWDYFHDAARPRLIDYVADRDLWRWQLTGSRQISAMLSSREQSWRTWDAMAAAMNDDGQMNLLMLEGQAILNKIDKDVATLISAARRAMVIGGRKVPVVNAPPFLASEVAGRLAEKSHFAATYYDGPRGRAFSLRSRGPDGADVAEIAATYGGGGHRNAAGFLMPLGWDGDA